MLLKMLKFCKKRKRILILWSEERKLLSDGIMSLYIGDIAPDWSERDCAVALELDEEAVKSFKTTEGVGIDFPIPPRENLQRAERLRYAIDIDGDVYQPFITEDKRILYFDTKRLSVFDGGNGVYEYYIETEAKRPVLYITSNGSVAGSIAPMLICAAELFEFASQIKRGAEYSCNTGFLNSDTQISIFDEEEE